MSTPIKPKDNTNNKPNIAPQTAVPETVKVIGVRFRPGGKAYYFDPGRTQYNIEDNAIVETSRGLEFGTVVIANKTVPGSAVVQPLRRSLRKANPADEHHHKQNQLKRKEAMIVCAKMIDSHKLDMKLVDVEYTFDNTKLLFYFTSDERVDFRELVKELASYFRCRIELRQMGVRDEARMLGGLAVCGRPYCCSTFLSDFAQVSIRMAKEQGISLNSTKVSGACGKLMCCLKFENDTYTEALKDMPKQDSIVITPDGEGVVAELRPLLKMLKVRLRGEDGPPKVFHLDDIKTKSNG